jgi:hypothetical protein
MVKRKLPETHYEKLDKYLRESHKTEIRSLIDGLYESSGKEELDDSVFSSATIWITGEDPSNIKTPSKLASFKSSRELLFHSYHFSERKKIYTLSEAITAKLTHTNLKKVDTHFLKSPFDQIFLEIPHNKEIYVPSGDEDFLVKGIYVNLEENLDCTNLRTSVDAKINEDGYDENLIFDGKPAEKRLKFLAIGEHETTGEDTMFFGTFFFSPGDMFPQLEAYIDKWAMETNPKKSNKPYLRKLFQFTLNSLLYITSGNSSTMPLHAKFTPYDKGKKASRSRVDKKNEGLSKINRMSVGSNIYLSKEFKELRESGIKSDRDMLCPKWIVQGHWRNQVHGIGNKLRKIIWIEPHVKGKDLEKDITAKSTVVS